MTPKKNTPRSNKTNSFKYHNWFIKEIIGNNKHHYQKSQVGISPYWVDKLYNLKINYVKVLNFIQVTIVIK